MPVINLELYDQEALGIFQRRFLHYKFILIDYKKLIKEAKDMNNKNYPSNFVLFTSENKDLQIDHNNSQ